MKVTLAAVLAAAAGVLANSIELPAGVPRSLEEFREKHPYKTRKTCGRPTYTIRPSANDTDDVSDDFLHALHTVNRGGSLYPPKGKTFMLGKPLDLTFLDDVHIILDGEIKFTNDTPFWQKNAFRHPFQNSIMFWKIGGKDIKIFGEGSLNGNGQRWWNEFAGLEILDPTNTLPPPGSVLCRERHRADYRRNST